MKATFLRAFVHFRIVIASLILASSASAALGASFTSRSHTTSGYDAHPYRDYNGTFYDFSEAIRWLKDDPGSSSPYPADSPLTKDWQFRKMKHESVAPKWTQYLVKGSPIESRAEGLLISVPIMKTVQTGTTMFGKAWVPVYNTIPGTKEVLLMNAPSTGVSLPVFAIPAGSKRVGTVLLEAFDYGRPLANPYAAAQLPRPTARRQMAATNAPAIAGEDSSSTTIAPSSLTPTVRWVQPERKQGQTTLNYEGEEIRDISRVVLTPNGKISVIWSASGMSAAPEKLDEAFLLSWGIVRK